MKTVEQIIEEEIHDLTASCYCRDIKHGGECNYCNDKFVLECLLERIKKETSKDDLYCGNCDSQFILKGWKKRQEEIKESRVLWMDGEEFDTMYGEGEYRRMKENDN